tara:strand:+ start:276 stop:491 length:216 start_codon:yes stop_codon:yes gene_type:complete
MIKETETVYHFYAKDECILHSIKEEDFKITWTTLKAMVGLMHTSYKEEDLTYIKLPEQKKEENPSLDDHSY